MSADQTAVRLCDVTRRFGRGPSSFALGTVALDCATGSWTAITGESGAGKSALLQIVATMDRAESGRVVLLDRDTSQLSEDALSLFRRRNIGLMHQQIHFIEHWTVWQNATARLIPAGVSAAQRKRRALTALHALRLNDLADRKPGTLSGGERQRLAVARTLMDDPPLVIADEPTSNLDHDTAHLILDTFSELTQRGVTLITATHDPQVLKRASAVLKIHSGRIVS